MDEIYLRILELLTPAAIPPTDEKELWIYNQLKKIKWIDLDYAQLEAYEMRPDVQFPCVLIDIEFPNTETQGKNNLQMCQARCTLRWAFNFLGGTAKNTPEVVRAQSLEYFNIVKAGYLALQGKKSVGSGSFDRKSIVTEKRADMFKVVANTFATTFLDKSAVIG